MISRRTPKSTLLFKFLTIISTLQHLSVVLREGLGGYPQSRLVDLIARILTAFTLEPYFEREEMSNFSTNVLMIGFWGLFLVILVSIFMLFCGLGSKSILKQESKTKMLSEAVYSTLLGVLLLILRAFGLFPLIQIFGSHFSCFLKNSAKVASSQCLGENLNIFGLFLSTSGLFFSISIAALNQVFINDSYFESKLPFSGFLSRLWKSEILIETLLALTTVSLQEVSKTLRFKNYQNSKILRMKKIKFQFLSLSEHLIGHCEDEFHHPALDHSTNTSLDEDLWLHQDLLPRECGEVLHWVESIRTVLDGWIDKQKLNSLTNKQRGESEG